MNTPDQLLAKLRQYETAESAVAIWREAQSYIKRYEEVKAQALDCAKSELSADGVIHAKYDGGVAGWTQPKTSRLDRERWATVLANDSQAAALQAEANRAAEALNRYQAENDCWVMPEKRFYIR